MHVLQNEGKPGLALVAVSRFTDGAGHRVEEERPIVGLAVVIAGRAEAQREDEDQECRREGPPRRLDEWGVERRQVRSPLVVCPGPRRPRRIDGKAAQHERGEGGPEPPRIAPQRGAEAAFLQVADGRRHRVTAAIVCFTASADFFSAPFSSAVNSTSIICSSPFLPSLHGTPQYIPDSPYSPSSQAAHGSSRF